MERFTQQQLEVVAKEHQLGDAGFGSDRALSLSRVNEVAQWIADSMVMVKTINRSAWSYTLKHVCEMDIQYVSNGEFITAAILLGYQHKRSGSNCWFNMGTGAINAARKRQASEGKR